jgi:hypothetical protein
MPKDGDGLFDDVNFNDHIEFDETGTVKGEAETTPTIKNEEEVESGDGKTTPTDKSVPNEELIEIDTQSNQEGDSTSASTEENKASTSSSSPFSSAVSALGAEGFIDFNQEDFDKAEDPAQYLRDALNARIEDKVKSSLTPKQLEAFEAYEKGVPLEAYTNSNARQQSYSSVTKERIEEDVDVQATLVLHDLMNKGMSEEEGKDYIKTLQDVGGDKLKEKAFTAQTSLIANEKLQRQNMLEQAEKEKAAQEEARAKGLSETEAYVNAQTSIVEGLELTDKVKKDLYKSMTTPVDKDAQGNPISVVGQTRNKDPKKFDMLMSYYHHLGLFDEKPDFSKILKVAETKVAKGLDALVNPNETVFDKSGGAKNASGDAKGGEDTTWANSF